MEQVVHLRQAANQQEAVSRRRVKRRKAADKDNQRRALKVVVGRADRVAVGRVARVARVARIGAVSISTTCLSVCQLFLWPMLRLATLSSFPVRRESIPLV